MKIQANPLDLLDPDEVLKALKDGGAREAAGRAGVVAIALLLPVTAAGRCAGLRRDEHPAPTSRRSRRRPSRCPISTAASVRLEDYRGKVVLLFFWATW